MDILTIKSSNIHTRPFPVTGVLGGCAAGRGLPGAPVLKLCLRVGTLIFSCVYDLVEVVCLRFSMSTTRQLNKKFVYELVWVRLDMSTT